MPRERRERDAKEPDTMKEESGTDASARSRKRKANVAVFLQDPDEEIAKIDRTVRSVGPCGGQSWDGNAACENPCSLIPTPDKDEDELAYPTSTHKPPGARPARASPLPVLNWANREEVWKIMLNKEKTYFRDKHLLQRHPLLQPKMRAILLDKAQAKKAILSEQNRVSPLPSGLLTPPPSGKKQSGEQGTA
uniref:Cyclin E1 n=1 Tax=Molossus molossus TaxID=27622 RepID=A0A7J8C697_MOLMO|nr:cyclin E1 [Molossus molossus]